MIQESKRPDCLKLICYSKQALTVKISFNQKLRGFSLSKMIYFVIIIITLQVR